MVEGVGVSIPRGGSFDQVWARNGGSSAQSCALLALFHGTTISQAESFESFAPKLWEPTSVGVMLGAATAAPGRTPCVLHVARNALFGIGGIGRSIRTESAQLEGTNREQIVDLVHESRLGLS